MIDTTTQKPLRVTTAGGAGPYLILPYEQLDQVTALLDANRIPYYVWDEVLSMDGGPEVAWIHFEDEGINAAVIQRLLDSIP
jgi:hypothetical protein